MTQNAADTIRAFIVENFLFGDTSQALADDASMLQNDLVDSTGILELVAFLEEHFGINVADAEIVPENLDSIARLQAYVTRKLDACAATGRAPTEENLGANNAG